MAIIQCSECGREVSDKAPNCPGCGAPIAKAPLPATAPKEVQARSGVADGVKLGCGMFIVLPILLFIAVVIFLAFVGAAGSGSTH